MWQWRCALCFFLVRTRNGLHRAELPQSAYRTYGLIRYGRMRGEKGNRFLRGEGKRRASEGPKHNSEAAQPICTSFETGTKWRRENVAEVARSQRSHLVQAAGKKERRKWESGGRVSENRKEKRVGVYSNGCAKKGSQKLPQNPPRESRGGAPGQRITIDKGAYKT